MGKIRDLELPRTGRIGRLAQIIKRESGEKVARIVMNDSEEYKLTSSYVKKAEWIRGAMKRLFKMVGREKSIEIMESCGRKCCGITRRNYAKDIMKKSKSIKDFIEKMNKKGIGGGRLKLIDENTITGGYDVCYCGQVKKTEEPFTDDIYCHCSVGWYKQLFETALERPVNVEILQSIITGSESCEFVIHI